MQKDELIQLHTFLYQIRSQLEQICEHNGFDHSAYEKLEITPYQIHKSKREHKLAVFTLSKDIAGILSGTRKHRRTLCAQGLLPCYYPKQLYVCATKIGNQRRYPAPGICFTIDIHNETK